MKKCTLCIDRIYNETLPENERVPACVATCPASARHFGDLGDPLPEDYAEQEHAEGDAEDDGGERGRDAEHQRHRRGGD